MMIGKCDKNLTLKKINYNEDTLSIYQRLFDFGFYEGMSVRIVRKILFGGPWIIQADSLYLALRDEEFALLEFVE